MKDKAILFSQSSFENSLLLRRSSTVAYQMLLIIPNSISTNPRSYFSKKLHTKQDATLPREALFIFKRYRSFSPLHLHKEFSQISDLNSHVEVLSKFTY